MASVFDSSLAVWDVARLRTPDAQFLQGATRAWGGLPDPIAIATGPNYVGPSGVVGVDQYWVSGSSVPPADVVWVLTKVDIHVARQSGAGGTPASLMWAPVGDPHDGDAVRGPFLGPGTDIGSVVIADGGTYVRLNTKADPSVSCMGSGLWVPLDPSDTQPGFQTVAFITAPAAGHGINTLQIELGSTVFLGFPIAVWGTGALWAPCGVRGS